MPYRLCLALAALLWSATALASESRLVIDGADGALATNLRQHIGDISERDLESPRRLRLRLQRAVPAALHALGYYQASHEVRVADGRLHISVEPGERMRWAESELSIEGPAADHPAFRALLRDHPFQSGSGMEHRTYDAYRDRWLRLAHEYGFFSAELVRHELLIDIPRNEATAHLQLVSGPRYTFRDSEYSGSGIDDGVLRRIDPMHQGKPYEREPVMKLHRDLQSTGYFDRVAVRTEQHDDHTVTTRVELEDAARHRYSIGVGFGTDTGPRTRLRWERPRINRAGHYMMAETQISQPVVQVTSEYRIPLRHPLNHFLSISGTHEQKDVEDTESIITNLRFDLNRRFDSGWLFSYGVRLQDERYRLGNDPRRQLFYVIPGANLSYLSIEPGIDPTRGHRTWLETAASHPSLGSDTTFLRTRVGHKRLLPLARNHLIIARAEAGAVVTRNSSDVPVSQRFFTGGDQTLRGYDFESIGAKDAEGNVIGGRYLNLASLEYSYRVSERWRTAAFLDAGRAYLDEGEPWRYGAGVGVRWLSPVGQIRLDLAVPVMDDEESGFRLHLFMGPPL